MKRFISILLGCVLMLTFVGTASAITGTESACEGVEFKETGYATFILDNSSRVTGALKPDEDLKKVGFQKAKKSYPTGLEDGKATRRRVFARVNLDEDYRVTKGGKKLEVTIILYDYDLVEEILNDEVTVENIIDATIYSPDVSCCKPHAAHIFLGANSDRVKVGKVCFKCGGYLDLYAGHFFGNCTLSLGFRAEAVKEEVTPCIPPCPTPCRPTCEPPCPQPCTPQVEVTTTTTVVTTVTTTTTTEIGTDGCHHGGCH